MIQRLQQVEAVTKNWVLLFIWDDGVDEHIEKNICIHQFKHLNIAKDHKMSKVRRNSLPKHEVLRDLTNNSIVGLLSYEFWL